VAADKAVITLKLEIDRRERMVWSLWNDREEFGFMMGGNTFAKRNFTRESNFTPVNRSGVLFCDKKSGILHKNNEK
jgi:hypothetical protein